MDGKHFSITKVENESITNEIDVLFFGTKFSRGLK